MVAAGAVFNDGNGNDSGHVHYTNGQMVPGLRWVMILMVKQQMIGVVNL